MIKNGRWHASNGKYTKFTWPPNDGFLGARNTKILSEGMLLDRYGGWIDSDGIFHD